MDIHFTFSLPFTKKGSCDVYNLAGLEILVKILSSRCFPGGVVEPRSAVEGLPDTLWMVSFGTSWFPKLLFSDSVVSDPFRLHRLAHQAPPSMGFSSQEYWSGLPFPPPGESSQQDIMAFKPCRPKMYSAASRSMLK